METATLAGVKEAILAVDQDQVLVTENEETNNQTIVVIWVIPIVSYGN